MLCQRHATSKLHEYEQLWNLSTFGFRGEALASISQVAKVTCISKTISSECAYKANYLLGKLKIGEDIQACAGNIGTQLIITDMFHAMPTRKQALRSFKDEHQRMVELVTKYAIHNPNVAFTLKKQQNNLADVVTQSNATTLNNIRLFYTSSLAKELIEIGQQEEEDRFSLQGFISNVNFSLKRANFIIFINHRLVECPSIRRAIEGIYQIFLPKQQHPFVYLSLQLDPHSLDVNVHPAKEVVYSGVCVCDVYVTWV